MKQSVKIRLQEYKARSHLRESSEEILDRAARWFIEQVNDDIDPVEVGYNHIDDYRSWLAKGRSKSSANTYLAIFKPFWGWLAKRNYIERDPFDGIKLYVVAEKKFETYSLDEVERILKVANPLWKTIICLALCSMREAEILNLVVSDIDFEKNLILISAKKNTAITWCWDIKDYHQAYIGFDESIAKLLIRSCEQLRNNQPYVCLKENYWQRNLILRDAGRLSHRKRNCPWGNFSRDYKALLSRAKVKIKRFHDLRSTFATERYNDGYSLKELQYLMRHSSIQTTATYIKNIDEQKLVAKSGRTFEKLYTTNVL